MTVTCSLLIISFKFQTLIFTFSAAAFFFGVFPKSFKRKYPLAVRNFRRNSRRLTTHFDVYETLKDIANLDGDVISNDKVKKRSEDLKERGGTMPRGISMFNEIPNDRTCDYAGIERLASQLVKTINYA